MNVLGRRSPFFGYGVREVAAEKPAEKSAPIVLAGGPPQAAPATAPPGAAGTKRAPASDQPTARPKEAERTPTGVQDPESKPEKAPPARKPLVEDDDESYVVMNRLP